MNVYIVGNKKNQALLRKQKPDEELSFINFIYCQIDTAESLEVVAKAQYLVLLLDKKMLAQNEFYYLLGCWHDHPQNISLYLPLEKDFPLDAYELKNYIPVFGDIISNYKILKIKLKSAYNVFLIDEKKREARKRLIGAGFSINLPEFIASVQKGELSHVKDFIEIGFSPSASTRKGVSLIALSIRNRQREIFSFLLEKGADLHVISQDRGYSLIIEAVAVDEIKILTRLLNYDLDINQLSKNGQTALILAAGQGEEAICSLLIQHGADVSIPDALGMTAFDYAQTFNFDSLLPILKKSDS